jgi:hypothetical protein
MKSRWWQPEIYRGTAVIDGTNCQATLRFSGDADRDGIPDIADAKPRGPVPVLPSQLQLRIKVGDQVQYELPGLGEGVSPVLSSSLSDLPSGLDYGEGVITGAATAEAVGVHEVVVGAANEAGESYQNLKIEVVPPDPVLDPRNSIVWTNGSSPLRHTVGVGEPAYPGFPFVFRARNLPPGMVLEQGTGILRPSRRGFAGAPPPGLYRVGVTVSHGGGGKASQVLLVESLPAPNGRWKVAQPLRFQIRLGGNGRTEISGLPAGCRANPGSGLIQGVPVEVGDFSVKARQRRGGDWLEETIVLGVDPADSMEATRADRMASTLGNGKGWNYPAIFSLGPRATQGLESNGRLRNLSTPARTYALLWSNVDGWKWEGGFAGLATRLKDSETALRRNERAAARQVLPSGRRLAQISYASGRPGSFLPTNHSFWLKDAGGVPRASAEVPGDWAVDFSQPEFVRLLCERVKFLVQSGCVDGVYLPGWDEAAAWPSGAFPLQGRAAESQGPVRLELLKRLREAVGPQGWIVAEAAGSSWALTGPMLDGIHLVGTTEPPPAWPPAEGWWPDPYMFREKNSPMTLWENLVRSIQYFSQEGVLRTPGNVALELWARHDWGDWRTKEPRLTGLAVSLCLSDGAYLYSRPDWWQSKGKLVEPGQHVWLAEWSESLGRPLVPPLREPDAQGFYRREFEKGWAVYAPLGLRAAAKMEFPEEVESVATGKHGPTHPLLPGHGDLFLRKNQAGLNQ